MHTPRSVAPFVSPAVLIALLTGAAGCRSAAPGAAPGLSPASETPPGTALPEDGVDPVPGVEPAWTEPSAEVDPAAELEVPPGDEAVGEGGAPIEDEDASEAQLAQKDALDLCQAAERLLDAGQRDEALAALDQAYARMLELPNGGDGAYLQSKEDIRVLVAQLLARAYRSDAPAPPAPAKWDLGLAIVSNDHVRREIRSFTGEERERFLEAYRRSGRHRPMILARLEAAGLPSQLSWLPLVESWFKERALSRASALGLWQFISSTGLRYGLTRDEWVDERLDPGKATDGAVAYLTELHRLFGDWPKALAAYNCGEARVMRLQRRSAEEYLDFWDLYELLPQETRRYVPRLFAALQIIEDPSSYGMTLPEPDPPLGDLPRVEVGRSVRLEDLDKALGLEAGTLAALNPELRYRATPRAAYALRVPAGPDSQAVLAAVTSVGEWKRPAVEYAFHRVRPGESVSTIARRYGTSVSAIVRANGLRSAHRIRVGQRLRIPSRGRVPVERVSRSVRRYRVAGGDTLAAIARAHAVALSRLLSANSLSERSTIYPGQTLLIPD